MSRTAVIACALFLASTAAGAGTAEDCLLSALRSAPDTVTVGELLKQCADARDPAASDPPPATDASMLGQRMELERYTRDNPFVLTAHRPNYILPLTYIRNPNQAIPDVADDELQEFEIQFQLSLKVLLVEGLYRDKGLLSVAYTNRSYWQAYNRDLSAAFRETNHEPELILTLEADRSLFGFRNTANQIIINHQSNGNSGDRSRSWNRLMLQAIFERDEFVFSLKPWYRIPEKRKSEPDDPVGDDNPDIERYMGHFELNVGWLRQRNMYNLMLRNNLRRSNNYGAIELSWSYPLKRRIKGVVKLFHGHGESLISYDRRTTSIGAGLLISDWL